MLLFVWFISCMNSEPVLVVSVLTLKFYAAFKGHPRNILHNENHLYGIILVHLIPNTALKTRKNLQAFGYRILKNR